MGVLHLVTRVGTTSFYLFLAFNK